MWATRSSYSLLMGMHNGSATLKDILEIYTELNIFSGDSVGKEATCSSGDTSLIPRFGRFPGAGHGNPLHYACLGNPIERGAWQATVHRVAESDMTEETEFSSVHFSC